MHNNHGFFAPAIMAVLLFTGFAIAGNAIAAELVARKVTVEPPLLEKKDDLAESVSAAACSTPPSAAPRDCLFVVDEGRYADFATLDATELRITPDENRRPEFMPDDADDLVAVGTPPDFSLVVVGGTYRRCGYAPNGFGEHDSEGVAFADGAYFITGSHGCGRKNDNYKLSTFLVVRINDATITRSFRLNEVLQEAPKTAPFFGKWPRQDGISIEGLAARSDRLLFGFRTPSAAGGLIVSVRRAALFDTGSDLAPEFIPVPLPTGTGIRDLALLDDRQLLILAGPGQEDNAGYRIMRFDLCDHGLDTLGELGDGGGSPEGLLVTTFSAEPSGAGHAEIIVLHDDTESGSPQVVAIDLPPRQQAGTC